MAVMTVDIASAILRLPRENKVLRQACFKDVHDALFCIFSVLVMFFIICRSH
jgi:hypothetical protein